ncbi:MAG: hypothetical protein COU08_02725 [Candidatus Harrisonbacteria bacterium CG10_big_fil_rev_8_21_14_0_10_42_17]|uniref:Heat-inducible transcription repressor HrcA C-terminal domain-containing protein n=1 Tax=Candidatus Harrisonbacteria bacterium CG10_big_fil_rev_8_21_14_0_10_42_17 TaxID=1974584 RepID=A0A2M6WHZ2_9BACT|nr:MAG: hypothetical protein COU08_02725 [Candidatus Harrisonbacteria bacterium CG10_big_fil_rev_8_21_14_0_10_42_17]
MLSNRSATILEAVINEFIETGIPVSSGGLYETYEFGVKPATIRNELHLLTEEGYLEQPHTSGGRVPTDKGYRFFVDRSLDSFDNRSINAMARLMQYVGKDLERKRFEQFIQSVAERLSVLSIGYEPERESMIKSGLHGLVSGMETEGSREIVDVVSDFEKLEKRIDRLMGSLHHGVPSVFIGESPITKSKHISVIAGKYNIAGTNLILIAVGPKRMDYHRNISFFKQLENFMK